MAAALCYPSADGALQQGKAEDQGGRGSTTLDGIAVGSGVHPIHFLYGHLHNSIRAELDNLSNWVLALEADNEEDLQQRLQHLKERYHFLEQVYKYHSSVEDEVRPHPCCFVSCKACCWSADADFVLLLLPLLLSRQVVYPALDSKVKNVTAGYSVEHQDEVIGVLPHNIGTAGSSRAATTPHTGCPSVQALLWTASCRVLQQLS